MNHALYPTRIISPSCKSEGYLLEDVQQSLHWKLRWVNPDLPDL